MSGIFYEGETKERPGIYHRVTNESAPESAGVREGVAGAAVSGNWGPLNTPITVEAGDDYEAVVGKGTGATVLKELFIGEVTKAIVTRVGEGGTAGTLKLKDTTASTPKETVTLTEKYVGDRPLTVSIRDSITDDSVREFIVYEGTKKLETKTFAAGGDESSALIAALADSAYFVSKAGATSDQPLAIITQATVTGGENPTVTSTSYSDGFNALEPMHPDHYVVDTNDHSVHVLLHSFIERIYQSGDYPMATVGEPSSVEYDTRMSNSKLLKDEKMHYVPKGWIDSDGNKLEGYVAAARIGGMICSISAADSLTHKAIKDAVSLIENWTNAQTINALKNGCLVISISKKGTVRIEKGINTLNEAGSDKDKGWSKIRRTKTRFELMSRIDESLDALDGEVNNDSNGRAAIILAGQKVIDDMVNEGKLESGGTFTLDESRPPVGDMAWFKINVDDIDSFEIGYLTYGYRFSAAE